MDGHGHLLVHRGLVCIALGAMKREYIPFFMEGANDFEVMKGVVLRPPITLEAELAWYDRMTQSKDIIFAILLHRPEAAEAKNRYEYIGHTGLHEITWPEGHATSGTIIAGFPYLNKGYGTEAKMLLLYEAFRNRGLRKVCSRVKAFNNNSFGHLLACGYKQAGRRKQHHFHNGTLVDSIELEVSREDWEPIWTKYQETKSLPRLTDEQRLLVQKETGVS